MSDKAAAAGFGAGRFGAWPALWARLALAALALLLVVSAMVPVDLPAGDPASAAARRAAHHERRASSDPEQVASALGDEDIALYIRAIRRIRAGQAYYDFIVPMQRASQYPVRPGVAVRLPTLAYLDAWLGPQGQVVAALALMLGVIAAWWRRLGEDSGSAPLRMIATALVFVGASLGLNRYFFPLHELWSGMLLALALGLHRIGFRGEGGRWLAAWLAAALALSIRELALPCVLLLLAFALWYRNWREAAAWAVLIAVFAGLWAWHLSIIAAQVLPGDHAGQGWLALRGLPGWLANEVQSSNLRWLPHWLAGPAVVLMTFGWLGWNSRAGTFGSCWARATRLCS